MLAEPRSLTATYCYLDCAKTKVAQYSKAVATVVEMNPLPLVTQIDS